MTQAIPEGCHSLTPHLVFDDAAAAIDFYQRAFGAIELFRLPAGGDDRRLMHACLQIGDSRLMMMDDFPEHNTTGKSRTPKALGGTPVTIHMYVGDADQVFQQAVDAGATPLMPVAETFWGDRYGVLLDPFGHAWSIATHVKDVDPADLSAAVAAGNCK